MPKAGSQLIDPNSVLCIVLGGGGGKGLFPLTRDRATPALPLASHYRLVDLPISNCINSGLRRIYILTQFNSASLHRHASLAYKFDQFSHGFVEILAAQQTPVDSSWYQGTADAVRKNLADFLQRGFEYALILSADQLYRIDFRELFSQHIRRNADVTIATVPVQRSEAGRLGILSLDPDCRVRAFAEKPAAGDGLEALAVSRSAAAELGLSEQGEELFLASMGIYLFTRAALEELLANDEPDFGHHILPMAAKTHRVYSYLFDGYWRDLGSVRSFFEANLGLVEDLPRFNFFDLVSPIFSQPLYLPSAKVNEATMDHVLLGAGCIVEGAEIRESVIGLRTLIGKGSRLHRVVSLGYDFYEKDRGPDEERNPDCLPLGIGRNTQIENAIIDRNARIGDNVVISPAGKPANLDHERYFIRDGIVVVPRHAVIPHGMVI